MILVSGVMLLLPDGHILVSRRSSNSKTYPNRWQIPGGKAEPGESAVTTAIREVREETGITLTVEQLSTPTAQVTQVVLKNEAGEDYRPTVFLVHFTTVPHVQQLEHGTQWRWISLAYLDSVKAHLVPGMVEAVSLVLRAWTRSNQGTNMNAGFPNDRIAQAIELRRRITLAKLDGEHGGKYLWNLPDELLLGLITDRLEREAMLGPFPPNGQHADGPLTNEDWLQFEMAASGCTSGISNWPWLKRAIQRVLKFRAIIDQHADKHGAVFGAHEVKLESEVGMRDLAHLLVAGLVTSGKEDVTITVEGVTLTSPIGITPPKQLGDFKVTVERKSAVVGSDARETVRGVFAPPSPNFFPGESPVGIAAMAGTPAPLPPHPVLGGVSRPADHIAIVQPLYTNTEPIEDQLAKIRTIYSYACLGTTCRHINRRSGPLADDATCEKCGQSLHHDKITDKT